MGIKTFTNVTKIILETLKKIKMGLTKQEDIWSCHECGELKGRHDLWFEGLCENCNAEKQNRDFYKEFYANRKKQISDEFQREHTGF